MKPENLKCRKLVGEWSEWTETELAYTGEQKGSVFVFDGPETEENEKTY